MRGPILSQHLFLGCVLLLARVGKQEQHSLILEKGLGHPYTQYSTQYPCILKVASNFCNGLLEHGSSCCPSWDMAFDFKVAAGDL